MTDEPSMDATAAEVKQATADATVGRLENVVLSRYGTAPEALRQVLARVLIADQLMGTVERGLESRGRLRPGGRSVQGMLVSFITGGADT